MNDGIFHSTIFGWSQEKVDDSTPRIAGNHESSKKNALNTGKPAHTATESALLQWISVYLSSVLYILFESSLVLLFFLDFSHQILYSSENNKKGKT